MPVNRLILFAVFLAAMLFATPLFNVGIASAAANAAPEKAHAWFFPAADPVPISPGDPPSLLTLWVAETKPSSPASNDSIVRIQVVQPAGFPYVLGGAEVYAFNGTNNSWSLVSGAGTGDWQVTTDYFGADVMGYTIVNLGGNKTQLKNESNYYNVLVIKIIVLGYKNPADALTGKTNEWRVSVGWDSGDSLDIFVDHTVDNTPPSIQLTPGTASLFAQPCLPGTSFWVNVTVSDNLPITGLNESTYGTYAQNGTDIVPSNLVSGFTLSNALSFNVGLQWMIDESLKNDYVLNGSNAKSFEPRGGLGGFVGANESTPIANTTEGEYGYLWVFAVIYIEVDFYPAGSFGEANYTYFARLIHMGGNLFTFNVNLLNAFKVQGPAWAPNTIGLALNNISQMRVTVVIAAFDATLDYHKDFPGTTPLVAPDDYNDTVAADFLVARNWYNLALSTYTFNIDVSASPIMATLNGAPIVGLVHNTEGPPSPFAPHLNYRTSMFTLIWTWLPPYGPDPTAQEFIIEVDRWNGTHWITVITDTVPAVPLSGPFFYMFSIEPFGTGNYSIHIYVRDCAGVRAPGYNVLYLPGDEERYEFNVTYFLVVYIRNNANSLWINGPAAWEQFEQNDLIPISVKTFGVKPDGSPLDWTDYSVNITINRQDPGPSITNVTTFVSATPDVVASTYAIWNFNVDSAVDLMNIIGIYNVTASWMNNSASPAFQVDNNFNIPPSVIEHATFILKPKIFLHFYVYNDTYSTGETATFFAHVADITWPAPGSGVPGAIVSYDVFRDADGVPMATGFWFTNSQGFVVPSTFGEITFGTEIGDDWAPGKYNVNATAMLNTTVGVWWNATNMSWSPVFAISTATATDSFDVWVYRDADIKQGFEDVLAAISGLSSDLANVANDVSNIIDILNNDVLPGLADLSTKLDNLANDLANVAGDVANIMDMLTNDVLPGLSDIMNQLGTLSSTVTDLQNAVADLQNAVADLQSTVAALSDIQTTLSNLENAVTDLQGAVDSLASQVSAIQSALSDVQDALGDVQSTLGRLSSQLADVQSALSDLAGAVADVQAALGDLSDAVADLQGAVSNLQSSLDSLASDVSAGFSDVQDALDSLAGDVSAGFSDLSSKVDSVSQSVSSAESNLAEKIDSVAGDLSGMATATLVLLVVAIAISAVTAFKVFKG